MSKNIWSDRLRYYLPTILVAVGVLLIWELATRALDIKQFLLPRPSAILASLVDQWPLIRPRVFSTTRGAVGGFAIGTLVGVGMAFVTARFTALREAMMPFAIAANSVPIIALSPIMLSLIHI